MSTDADVARIYCRVIERTDMVFDEVPGVDMHCLCAWHD